MNVVILIQFSSPRRKNAGIVILQYMTKHSETQDSELREFYLDILRDH